MDEPARRVATYEDLLASPEHLVAELIDGVLYQSPVTAGLHALARTTIAGELAPRFSRTTLASESWITLNQPEIHLGGDVIVPDVAGWRRSTLPELPDAPFFEVRPDWVCEVSAPSTRALDRMKKLPVYQRARVPHVWLIEPLDELLEVLELDGATYRIIDRADGDEPRRLRPFEAIEFDVGALWAR